MAANWLKLNDSKTEFIIFGKQKLLDGVGIDSVKLGDSTVAAVDSVRSIGAHLDSNLKMKKQISQMCKSAYFNLHQISRIKKYLMPIQLKTLIHSHVTSRLDYNNCLLIGIPSKDISRLQLVQNSAARLIAGLKKKDHITPTLVKLHWLPVKYRILYKLLLLTFKSLNGKGPEYLQELLIPYIPSRSLRSSNDCKLLVPKTNFVETAKRAFCVRAPQEWNNLPAWLRNKTTVDSFKNNLKTYLFKQAYH